MWVFRLNDRGVFEVLPQARLWRFINGTDGVPANSDGFLYIADVFVEMKARKPVQGHVHGFFKHRVLANGRKDPAHWDDGMQAAVDLVGAMSPRLKETDRLIGEERFARRYIENQHRWKPTTPQLNQLVAAINQRAKRKIL